MAMVVQHNLQAMNANRLLSITTGAQSKSTEKLSSGYKINRAADDAAGLTISEKMRKQVRGLDRASTNAEDGVSCVQTAEGALTEVHDMLQRMNELAVQSANGTNAEKDRQAIQDEIDQLIEEIDRVSTTTKFNEMYLLKGDKDAGTQDVYAYIVATNPASFAAVTAGTSFYAAGQTNAATTLSNADILTELNNGRPIYTSAATVSKQDAADAYSSTDIGFAGASITGITNNGAGTYSVSSTASISGTFKYVAGSSCWVDTADASKTYTSASLGISNTASESGNDQLTIVAATIAVTGDVYAENGTQKLSVTEIINAAAAAGGATFYKSAATVSQTAATDGVDYNYSPTSVGLATLYDAAGNAIDAKDLGDKIAAGTTLYSDQGGANAVAAADMSKYTKKTTINEPLVFNLHVGADSSKDNKISVQIDSMSSGGIGVFGLDVATEESATAAIDTISAAIDKVSKQRSAIGAIQNRLEHTINNLDNVVENTAAAESRIRDTDMAEEMVEYSKNNILAQAGQSMLAQANQSTQGVLSLLQ